MPSHKGYTNESVDRSLDHQVAIGVLDSWQPKLGHGYLVRFAGTFFSYTFTLDQTYALCVALAEIERLQTRLETVQ